MLPHWAILTVAVALIFLEAFFLYKAAANRKRANLIAGTPLTKVAELGGGRARVEGRATAFSRRLEAPLSGTPCVYFRFKVEEKRTHPGGPHGGGGSHWKTVIDDVQSVPCGVDDGTGIVGVNLAEAEVVLSPGTQTRSGFLNDAPPRVEQVLQERYGRSSKGWIFNKGMRYTETLIEEGDDLLVLGDVHGTPGGNWEFGKGDGPCIVSDQDERAVVASYRRFALLWLVVAVLVPVVPCVVLVVLFR
jgi:hypothetical protein